MKKLLLLTPLFIIIGLAIGVGASLIYAQLTYRPDFDIAETYQSSSFTTINQTTGNAEVFAIKNNIISNILKISLDKNTSSRFSLYSMRLDGSDILAINSDQIFTTASIYKLFVVYSMIHAVEEGRATWGTALNGTTLEICFEKTIEISDNDCPEAWIRRVGEQTINREIQDLGVLKNTKFTGTNNTTTAEDIANFLLKLQDNETISEDSRQKLIDAMLNNQYREGIPAKIPQTSADVASKVGFLGSLLHDAAIVFPKDGSPYILVILTYQRNWQTVADASELIYSLYNL
jgi:beta-lactamase class A